MDTGPSPPLIINEETESSTGTIDGKTTCPSLPDGLPLTLINKIKQIEESLSVDHANSSTGKLTCKVKTSYDKQLVDIDNDCKSLKIKTRVTVLEYLAYRFGINRTSLMNRIKRVLKKQETGIVDLDAALAQLKEAVNLAMLPLLSKYKIDLEKYENERKQMEDTPTPSVKIESPGDDSTPVPPVIANGKKLQKPQRKFTWTERIRLLLVTVVKAKVEKELMNKSRTQTGEEIILEFIETHVRPLWPKGWVQKKALYKMTESAHFKLTQSNSQLKKPVQVKKEKLSKDDSLTQSSSTLIPQATTPTTTPTTVSDVSLSLKGTASVNTPQLSQTSPIKITPTLIKGRVDLTTPIIKTATPPSPHKRVGLATPPKLVSPTVNKSPPVDFTDLQNKLKSVPPIVIKGASPIANVGVAKGATPPPLLIKGASPSVGVSVPSRSVITGAKATPSHTNVITSRGLTPPSKATPPSVDPHHKVIKKSTKVQSVQLPKQTIDALLSVLKNTNSSIYTSDLAQLVTVTTTRQQTTPTQRPVTLSPSPSSVRIVQAPPPPPATPPATVPSVHPLTDHYYVAAPSSVQYVPASTSGVSLITGNFINKTSSNN